jgi:hypothetical protein
MYQKFTFALLALFIVCPARAQNPYITAPANYQLVFENESVRVSRAVFAPGDRLPVHDHPGDPTVFVYLTDGGPIRFTHVKPAFTVQRPAVQAGAIRYHTGAKETHIVEYLGDTPSRYLRIELKTERPEKAQHIRIAASDSRPFENAQVRISRSECPPESDCAVTTYPAVIVNLNDGTASWHEAGSAFRNASKEASQLVRVQLKSPASAAPSENGVAHE